MGGATGVHDKLTSQQASSPQVQLGAVSQDCPAFDSDPEVPPIELSSPWWWEDFRGFLLEGIEDICGSQEEVGLEGSAHVSELPEVCVFKKERESERKHKYQHLIMSVDRWASTWRL